MRSRAGGAGDVEYDVFRAQGSGQAGGEGERWQKGERTESCSSHTMEVFVKDRLLNLL